jgi:hypothetical protein
VGARKIPIAKNLKSSKSLHYVKGVMKTESTSYPHGCCLLVEHEQIQNGIPERYICDDGYVCFKMLKPRDSNPMRYLKICNDALCYHLSLMIYCIDFTGGESSFYLKNMQFYGLWPLSKFDRSKGLLRGAQKFTFKLIVFIWFLLIYVELVFRGLLKKPLHKINWAAYKWSEEQALTAINK